MELVSTARCLAIGPSARALEPPLAALAPRSYLELCVFTPLDVGDRAYSS